MLKATVFLLCLLFPLPALAATTVVITEIAWMGSANSGNDEWLELYNTTADDIDLTGWTLLAADGSPTIELEGVLLANGYFLLERTDDDSLPNFTANQIYSGALGNNGEWLKLYNHAGQLIDQVNAADGWPAGDNETKQTMELVNDLWQTSAQPNGSPGSITEATTTENSIDKNDKTENQPMSNETLVTSKINQHDIIINEVFPNPSGPDISDEFIELKNTSAVPVEITGWHLTTEHQTYILPSLKIWPGVIVTFWRRETKLAINNTREKISLYTPNDQLIDRLEYKNAPGQNLSYQRTTSLDAIWGVPSPQQENSTKPEPAPVIVFNPPVEGLVSKFIQFDASDSFDPENRELKFLWHFGDGRNDQGYAVRQIYTQPGTYQATLKIIASPYASSTKDFKINIIDGEKPSTQATSTSTTTEVIRSEPLSTETPFIFISEFLPNPTDSDNQEFIELYSAHPYPVNLGGWQLDDDVNGSRPYTIPDKTIISPGEYLSFSKTQTKIALNNDHDAVQLFSPTGLLVSYAEYDQPAEGVSLVLDEQSGWLETTTPTPGEINVLDAGSATTTKTIPTPQVLGSETETPVQQQGLPGRYLFSIISAAGVVGIALFSIFFKNK